MKAKIGQTLNIGLRTEHNARTYEFDIAKWRGMWPEATAINVIVQRPGDKTAYPAVSSVDGDTVTWTVKRYDTERPGAGEMWVAFVNGDKLLGLTPKSAIIVQEGPEMIPGDTPASDTPPWVQKVLDAAANMQPGTGGGGIPGEDGGYYVPDVNQDTGDISWQASKPGMPDVPVSNIKGPQGPPGSDADVTKQNIAAALGYTPAKQEDVKSLTEEIVKQRNEKPLVYIDGVIPTTKDNVLATMTVKSKWLNIFAYIKIKCQGTSSMSYPKKNFTVTLFQDEARTIPLYITIPGWKHPSNKFVLKANYIDHLHARNIISARLWSEIVASRTDYDTLPEEFRNSPNNGAVDGFPIIVTTNGSYQGVYTWNIGKDAWLWGMDEDNPYHILLCAETNTDNEVIDTPCNFRTLWNGVNEQDWSVEVGENSESVKTALNALISCVKDTDDATFKATIGDHLDLRSAIDYWIFQYVICGIDGLAKNMLLGKYSEKKWICGAYDLDSTFGLWWTGASFVSAMTKCPEGYQEKRSLLWERISALYADEVKARYAELRESVLSYANITSMFEEFCKQIGRDAYADDLVAYPDIPSGETNNIWQLRNYIRDRLKYVDSMILGAGKNNVEYIKGDGNSWIDTGLLIDNDMIIEASIENPQLKPYENYFGTYGNEFSFGVDSDGKYPVGWPVALYVDGEDCTEPYIPDHNLETVTKRTIAFDLSALNKEFATIYSLWLFAKRKNYAPDSPDVPGDFTLYGAKITRKSTGEVLREFFPVTDANGVPCLYDRVTRELYYNAGTGTFTAPTA